MRDFFVGESKNLLISLCHTINFFTFSKIKIYNARDFKIHRRKQTAFRG